MSDSSVGYPPGFSPSDLPEVPLEPPPVILWFKIYALIFTLLYALLIVGGLIFGISGALSGDDDVAIPFIAMGAVWMVIGFVLTVLFAIPLFFKPRPWIWIYAIVLICLTMTNLCCLPAAIPLVIYWVKDENRRYHGMH